MARSLAVLLVAAVLTPAVAGRGDDKAAGAPERRPNIVFVLTDDLTADLLAYMPTVRALQRRGTTFSRYIVSNSLCCPSRATILTGRFPHNTGVRTNVWPDGGRDVFRARGGERRNIATDLDARGYRTALFGKYLNEYQPTSGDVPPGWDTWAVSGKGYHGYRYNLNTDGRIRKYGERPRDYMTDVMKRRSLGVIEQAADAGDPFFLYLSPFTPHGPATPARRHARRFRGMRAPRDPAWNQTIENGPSWLEGRRPLSAEQIARLDERQRRRAQSVLAIDDMIAAILRRVRARGLMDRTYIVFTSDNGFHLGQHRLMMGKMTAFDYDIRVPLIIAGPGVAPGYTAHELVQNVDLRPTLADLAGARVQGGADGRSVVRALRGLPLRNWRRAALVEHRGPDLLPTDPDWERAPGGNPTSYNALRFDGGLFVESANGEREYYDLDRDPHALRNAYRDLDQAQREKLIERLDALRYCRGRVSCFRAGRG